MQSTTDTIAAIATAPGAAGIAIIRISGSKAFAIADTVFRCKPPTPSQRPAMHIVYGHLTDGSKDIDEALLLPFRAPASYTREDVVELHVHGGSISARTALQVILQQGARLAAPGEFTRRAFLHGRIDLLQAEAVMDLIAAKSQRAAAAALEQLEGNLSRSFDAIYDDLIAVSADLEAQLDFDEDELPARTTADLLLRLGLARKQLEGLLSTWEEGHRLREGTLVVLAGRPNAGKSTLLNLLLGKERAIVTPIAGTTRDSLEEEVVLQGFPLRIVDTAGLRTADCEIEQEGIRRSRALMDKAEIVILLIDASRPLDPEDHALLESCPPDTTLVLLNKIDLGQRVTPADIPQKHVVSCSLLQSHCHSDADQQPAEIPASSFVLRTPADRGKASTTNTGGPDPKPFVVPPSGGGSSSPERDDRQTPGIDACKQALCEMLHLTTQSESHAVISERHRAMAQATVEAIRQTETTLQSRGESSEMLASLALRDGVEQLGQITGRSYHDNLLEAIFIRFCVGK